MYQACIFDMDGTIVNTLASIASIGNEALAMVSLPPIEEEAYRHMVGNGADVLIRRMLSYHTIPNADLDRFATSLRRAYDIVYARDPFRLISAYPGISDALRTLKKATVRLGVLSNKPDDMTKRIANRLFPDMFDIVRGQQEGIPLKPDPAGLHAICRDLLRGNVPEQFAHRHALYLGDSDVDIETGRNADVCTIGVAWGFRGRKELLQKGASHVIASPAEIPQFCL